MLTNNNIDYSMLKNQAKLGKVINTYLDGNTEKKKRKHEQEELMKEDDEVENNILKRSSLERDKFEFLAGIDKEKCNSGNNKSY
jgi:hypothetical protein